MRNIYSKQTLLPVLVPASNRGGDCDMLWPPPRRWVRLLRPRGESETSKYSLEIKAGRTSLASNTPFLSALEMPFVFSLSCALALAKSYRQHGQDSSLGWKNQRMKHELLISKERQIAGRGTTLGFLCCSLPRSPLYLGPTFLSIQHPPASWSHCASVSSGLWAER